jgi:hypothetical protein
VSYRWIVGFALHPKQRSILGIGAPELASAMARGGMKMQESNCGQETRPLPQELRDCFRCVASLSRVPWFHWPASNKKTGERVSFFNQLAGC